VTVTGTSVTRAVGRDLRVDAVRGSALVSMYLAHCAPTAGPGHVLTISEYATYPLFALLVGVGAELGSRSAPRTWWVGPLVRGTVLIGTAEVLERIGAHVWIVLAFLGVLTWLAAPLARARPEVVAGAGLAALLVAPRLNALVTTWTPDQFPGGLTTFHLARFLVVGGPDYRGPYQLVSMVFFAAVGILLSRYLLTREKGADGRRLAIGLACAVVSAVWFGLYEAGAFAMAAYEVIYRVLVLDALLVVAITLVVAALADRLPTLATPLVAMGAMSLTLYSLQIAWLGYDVRVLHPDAADDSWLNVAVLVVGSIVLALAWRAVVRVEPWRRGPLEGPVAAVVRALTGRRVRA
jgi:hypothetical protein